MKKLVLILFAGISFATANAQGQLQFGVKGGLNLSTVTVSDGYSGYSYSSLANFNAGLFLKIPVIRYFSVQPEVYYSGQGFKGSYSGDPYTDHVNYLNIPVLAKFTHGSGFFAETGPQLGLKLSAKEKYSDGTSIDAGTAYNSADFSWVFGVGYKIPMAPVGIDLRYNVGVTNIYNDPNYGNGYGQPGVRNGVFQLDVYFILWHAPGR